MKQAPQSVKTDFLILPSWTDFHPAISCHDLVGHVIAHTVFHHLALPLLKELAADCIVYGNGAPVEAEGIGDNCLFVKLKEHVIVHAHLKGDRGLK